MKTIEQPKAYEHLRLQANYRSRSMRCRLSQAIDGTLAAPPGSHRDLFCGVAA